MPKVHMDFDIQVVFLKEGDIFVCMSPSLDLVSHGDSYEDALRSFKTTLKIFLTETVKLGTLKKVLLDCGWTAEGKKLVAPRIIEQGQSVHVEV